MKRLLNYIVILSLSLFVFGCDSGPTIDVSSDEYKYIEETEGDVIQYKGVPFNGILTETFENGQLMGKGSFKDGKRDGHYELYSENGQLKEKGTYKDGQFIGFFEEYNEDGWKLTGEEVDNMVNRILKEERENALERLQKDLSERHQKDISERHRKFVKKMDSIRGQNLLEWELELQKYRIPPPD